MEAAGRKDGGVLVTPTRRVVCVDCGTVMHAIRGTGGIGGGPREGAGALSRYRPGGQALLRALYGASDRLGIGDGSDGRLDMDLFADNLSSLITTCPDMR